LSESVRHSVRPLFGELLAGGWHAERSPEFPLSEFVGRMDEYGNALRKFDGEVMLLWGGQSNSYDERAAAEFARGREMIILKEAANFPMWEQPEKYLEEVAEFFRA